MCYSVTVISATLLDINVIRTDPYTPTERVCECLGCGNRVAGGAGSCPDCGIDMENIAVARE